MTCEVCGTPLGASKFPVCVIHAALAPRVVYVRRAKVTIPPPPTERERRVFALLPDLRDDL